MHPYGFREDAAARAPTRSRIGTCVRADVPARKPVSRMEPVVLDLVYVLGAIALFVVIGLIGKAVEKL